MVIIDINGTKVNGTDQQADAIAQLVDCRAGGIAVVHGYMPTTNYITPPVQDIRFLSIVSTAKFYERRIAALAAVTLDDIAEAIQADATLSTMSYVDIQELFSTRRQFEIDSMTSTLNNTADRSTGHRAGHDRCYVQISTGIKVNLVTETVEQDDGSKIKIPVPADNGLPTVASVMLSGFYLKVTTVVEGQRKAPRKSKAPVLMSNAIKSVLTEPGLNLKMLSLKDGNFDQVSIDHKAITEVA